MTSPRITFTYVNPLPESLDLLQIEQSDWSDYLGVLTKSGMVENLREMLYGLETGKEIDCGLIDGDMVCDIDVYPRVLGLVYQFATSSGNLSERREVTITLTETLNFSLESSVTPDHPPLVIISARWIHEAYDVEGNAITPPPLSIVDGAIIIPFPVYGAVEVVYTTERHRYTLTVPPRGDDAFDNFFSAAVYGWYEGGVDWLEIDLPPGATGDEDDLCPVGDSGAVIDDDDPDYEQPVAGNRLTIVDYCAQKTLDEEVW